MAGVSINRKRQERKPDVELVTPHGAQITVTAERAAQLLARPGIRLGDGKLRKYVSEGEDPIQDEPTTGASAPRTGSRSNTPED